jgi:hypothetical protein
MASEIDKRLTELMALAKPAARRKAIRAALAFLRKQNRDRIRAQQNPDSTPYAPRKQGANVGKTWVAYQHPTDGHQVYIGKLGRVTNGRVKMTLDDASKPIWLDVENIKAQRKIKPRRGKMLTGFAKHLQIKMFGSSLGVLNFKRGSVKLARVHHFGQALANGGHLAARQLLGLPEADKQRAIEIMLDVLTAKTTSEPLLNSEA